mmetsp:Transcript_54247/g.162403  ORF Transcript_54247/g.162403 Transcript_54247/m.162403 type:complete len:268 (+) Transcript_54247:675-1478(+)
MARICGAHHVLGIKALLGQLGHRQCTVLLRATRSEWCIPHHEEMETGEGNHVNRQLTQVAVELPGETEAACCAANSSCNQVIQITIRGSCELERSEANVIQRFIVESEALIRILHELMNRKSRIVWLYNGVGHLWRRDHRVCRHDTIRILLPNFGDEKSSHARSCSTSHGMCQLETLHAVAALRLLPNDIQYGVNELSSLRVMSLRPVVTSAGLPKNKVVRAEKLAKGSGADRVHRSWLEIHENCSGNVTPPSRLIEINIDTFELQV